MLPKADVVRDGCPNADDEGAEACPNGDDEAEADPKADWPGAAAFPNCELVEPAPEPVGNNALVSGVR